ncbi:MAG: nitronate monooxygenase [Proteobacteria bacterium]|nr:nitronate monooxygenase [Pseudomonadota bacterium]
MNKLDNYRLKLGTDEYVPIMIGGMGVNISTPEMVLEGARLGGIAHLSDALICAISDRYYKTDYVQQRSKKYKSLNKQDDKSFAQFDLESVKESTRLLVANTMDKKQGSGGVFINLMEKLTMNNPRETLQARLHGALDGGVDGISLGAGLHLSSLDLIQDHPRFRDVKIGIIVSSVRALKLFLKRTVRVKRAPDYVVVEGPLAGGHLGFGIDDWHTYDLKTIMQEVIQFLKQQDLDIPVIPAGGIFTGSDAVELMNDGASAVQVATRFTVAKESGLPDKAKQAYFEANEEDIEVNLISPTGYPMRMLRKSPCIGTGIKPNCESLGYVLDRNGDCSYIHAYNEARAQNPDRVSVQGKTCLCTQMRAYNTWTCGQTTYRLKDTTNKLIDGIYQQPTTEDIFNDYRYSINNNIILPTLPKAC